MTQSTPERKPCGTCGNEYTVVANGTVRHHFTDNPDFQAGPDSRRCNGAGQPPAGAAPAGDQTADSDLLGYICRTCHHPVQLTANDRARTHLNPNGDRCDGGSDWPLRVDRKGNRTDTAPAEQTMADQLRDAGDTECPHPEYGTDQYGDRACIVCGAVDRSSAAEPAVAGGVPQASAFTALLEREVGNHGTVLDRVKILEQRTPDSGRPKGFDPKCSGCDTDNHRCPGCGDDVPHGTAACDDCDRRATANRLPKGETEDGRPCFHDDAVFGVEDDRMVCVACGTPCTHPDGFTENDPVEDDGECLVFRCGLCGAADRGAECAHERYQNFGPKAGVRCVACNAKHPDPHAYAADVRIATVEAERAEEDRQHHQAVSEGMADQRKRWQALNEEMARQRAKDTGPVLLGDLKVGEHFVRRGTVMRVTDTLSGDVHAVVVEGPMTGREGVLPDNYETVERAPAPQPKEQETKECTDSKQAAQTSPRSSSASATTTANPTTTAPAPGSRPSTAASAPAVLPESNPVTSSAPTATAAGNGRSAAVTTDQSAAAAAFLGGGPPSAQPAGPTNQADAAAQFLAGGSGAHGEKETKRDRFGRYLIPHPDTGREQAWTRATTFAKSISDTFALSQWGLRMALLGATMRPDIVQRAHGKHVSADKALLDELTAELKNAAGDKVAANLGTAMHSFTEMADRAWHSPGGPRSIMNQVPPDCRGDVETYIRLLEETGLEPVPHLIEFTTVVKQYGVAGTSDNCYKVTRPLTLKIGRAEVLLNPGEYVIGDKKTGRSLDYGWQEIAIQLGTYAQGLSTAGVWDRHEEQWHPDPLNGAKVRLDAGIVVHLPVDKSGKKQPAVYGLDLESGWNAAVLCERVRTWRKVRNLASPVMVSQAEAFAPQRPVTTRTTVRPASLMDKANAVTSKGEASAVWKEAKTAGLPDAEVDELVAVMQARLKKLAEPGG